MNAGLLLVMVLFALLCVCMIVLVCRSRHFKRRNANGSRIGMTPTASTESLTTGSEPVSSTFSAEDLLAFLGNVNTAGAVVDINDDNV